MMQHETKIAGIRQSTPFSEIVSWLYINDKAYESTYEWREAFLNMLKKQLERYEQI
jgi:hypothetical protein